MIVSVVIPVHNGAGLISACLDSVYASTGIESDELDVVVVDDGSTDHVEEVVRKYPLLFIRIRKAGVAAARNTGINSARGDILLFFDADVILKKDTIQRFLKHLAADTDARVIQGRWDVTSPRPDFACKFQLLKYHYCFHDLFRTSNRVAVANLETGCLAVKRDVFKETGLFDTNYKKAGGEEHELGVRMLRTCQIYYYDDIFVEHAFGGIGSLLKKIWFRTVNFTMLMLKPENSNLMKLHPSAPFRERLNLLLLASAFISVPIAWYDFTLFRLGMGAIILLYIAGNLGFLAYLTRAEGIFFAMRGLACDGLLTFPKLGGGLSALFLYFIAGRKDYRI